MFMCLTGKLALKSEDEILNTTAETSLDNKKVTCKKIIVLFEQCHKSLYSCYY